MKTYQLFIFIIKSDGNSKDAETQSYRKANPLNNKLTQKSPLKGDLGVYFTFYFLLPTFDLTRCQTNI